MSDALFVVIVLVVALGGLAAAAYLIEKRSKKSPSKVPLMPEPGPVGRVLFWVTRVLVVFLVLCAVGAFVFKSLALVWVAFGLILLGVVIGRIYHGVRLFGK
jgi:hypothetical protein